MRGPILALVLLIAASTTVMAGSFSAEQKAEIGKITREYLMANPDVISEAVKALEARREAKRQAAVEGLVKRNRAAIERADGDPVGGNPDGKVTVVEFFDYNCPYCRKAKPVVEKLLQDDDNVRYVFKEYPILAASSKRAARIALAVWKLAPDKYWSLHRALMKTRGRLNDEQIRAAVVGTGLKWADVLEAAKSKDIDAKLAANHALAQKLGINGTPTFIIGNQMFPGLVPLKKLEAAVAQAAD